MMILIIGYGLAITSGDSLINAVRDGKVSAVAHILQENTSHPNLNNALHIAAYYEQPEIAELLLAYKANSNARSNIKNTATAGTALHTAIYRNSLQTARIILHHGIDPNQRIAPMNGSRPLHITNSMDAVHLLIHYHADTTQKDNTAIEDTSSPTMRMQFSGKTPLERLFQKVCSPYYHKNKKALNMICVFLGYNAQITPLNQRVHMHAEDQRSIEIDRVLAGYVSHLNHITPLQALRICIGRTDNNNVRCLLKKYNIPPKAYETLLSDCALFNNLPMLAMITSTRCIANKHIAHAFNRTARLGSADDAGWIYVHSPQAVVQYHNTLSPPAQRAYSHAKQQKALVENRHMNHFTDCDIVCSTSSNNDH